MLSISSNGKNKLPKTKTETPPPPPPVNTNKVTTAFNDPERKPTLEYIRDLRKRKKVKDLVSVEDYYRTNNRPVLADQVKGGEEALKPSVTHQTAWFETAKRKEETLISPFSHQKRVLEPIQTRLIEEPCLPPFRHRTLTPYGSLNARLMSGEPFIPDGYEIDWGKIIGVTAQVFGFSWLAVEVVKLIKDGLGSSSDKETFKQSLLEETGIDLNDR